MNTRPCSRVHPLPLFHAEPDVWNSLDGATREQVLDCLGLLLLRHLQPAARCAGQERTLTKGNPT